MAMQGFAGLILFSVFVLMALGLAIIFGQMGVINMAHGEFMILGAYVTFLTSAAVHDLSAVACSAPTSSSPSCWPSAPRARWACWSSGR